MSIFDLALPRPQSAERCWTILLLRPNPPGTPLPPHTMTAAEQMFFFGAPTAHVVAYEDHLSLSRRELAARRQARALRTYDFARELAAGAALPRVSASGRG